MKWFLLSFAVLSTTFVTPSFAQTPQHTEITVQLTADTGQEGLTDLVAQTNAEILDLASRFKCSHLQTHNSVQEKTQMGLGNGYTGSIEGTANCPNVDAIAGTVQAGISTGEPNKISIYGIFNGQHVTTPARTPIRHTPLEIFERATKNYVDALVQVRFIDVHQPRNILVRAGNWVRSQMGADHN
jgi:hypothetical protein